MNTYTFGISGSWWWLILSVIIAAGFSIYTYRRTVPPVSRAKKTILVTLRSSALALLLFMLFEPVFTTITGTEKAPKLAVLLDNSMSVAHKDAKIDRKEDYKKAFNNSDFMSLGASNLDIILFDSELKLLSTQQNEKFTFDSLKFKGQLTDISKALRHVINSPDDENIRSVLLITDGAFNTGNNPIYDAEVIGKPVYVIGIGDSTEPKDILIQSLVTNEVAYVDNPVPVNINIKTNGYDKGELTVTLLDNGNKVKEQKINLNPDRAAYSVIMEYRPETKGIHKLTATVSSMEGEITLKNNSYSDFIKVLKNKRKIVFFAGAPSSDLSFIKNTLSREKGVEIKSFIQKIGSEFYGQPPIKADLREAELIIFVGFPINSTPVSVLNMIKEELKRGKPIFFIASRNTDYVKLRMLEDYLPFRTMTSRTNEFLALPDIKPEALSSPILRIYGSKDDLKYWNSLPPLYRTETFVEVKPESRVIAGVKVNNVPIKEPLIITRAFQNHKSLAVLGYGLYRWKLIGYAADIAKNRTETPDLFDIFINNAVRWLSVKQDNKNIRIKTTKKNYTNKESVEFIAQVYDASYTPVDNANVKVNIRGGGEVRDIILNSLGNGRYTGSIDGLPEDDYAYSGEVTLNGNKLGSDNGRFSVGEIALEFINLRMNASLLRNIAERSGGKFYTSADAGRFLDDLKSNPAFKPRAVTLRSEFALWNLPWILAAAILLFSLEWFLRKKFGMI